MPPGPPGHPGMHGLPPPGMGMPPHMMPPRPGIILIRCQSPKYENGF